MDERLLQESERLEMTWSERDPAHLQRYLVSGVEDPRLNLQSIFSRHFILRQLIGGRASDLMREEHRFSAVMNWLVRGARQAGDPAGCAEILHTLRAGGDNAEGIAIPGFVARAFGDLAAGAATGAPNYIEQFLTQSTFAGGRPVLPHPGVDTCCNLWRRELREEAPAESGTLRVLEPACGSANDYRYLHAAGITRHIDYTGFDLCQINVDNARDLFPQARFIKGNVFEIDAPDQDFDLCFVHDLFEHLSLRGLETAVRELCRVTSRGICANFFNMDENEAHVERPWNDYHWNTLSMARTRELFLREGFHCRVRNIGAFLQEDLGCDYCHNPNAYTFFLWREEGRVGD